MKYRKEHKVTKKEAIRRIDHFLDELIKSKFNNVKISDPEKEWKENTMVFSFKAKKFPLSAVIEGKIIVNDDYAEITIDIPGIVKTFVGEDKIREVIDDNFKKLFG